MRPQGYAQVGAAPEDLGWNDMGFEPPRPSLELLRDEQHDAFGEQLAGPATRNPLAALTPASPVHGQQAELAERLRGDGNDAADDERGDEVDEDEVDETAEPYDPADMADIDALPTGPLFGAAPADANDEPEPATPIAPVVPDNAIAPLARSTAVPRAPDGQPAPRAAAKAAFTLRLDPERHLRLRLASAVTGRSAQRLLIEALDQMIVSMPKLDSLARQAPAAGKRAIPEG